MDPSNRWFVGSARTLPADHGRVSRESGRGSWLLS